MQIKFIHKKLNINGFQYKFKFVYGNKEIIFSTKKGDKFIPEKKLSCHEAIMLYNEIRERKDYIKSRINDYKK